MSTTSILPTEGVLEGGCDCGQIRYRLHAPPLFVHCCHCRWCQRETGAAFAVNAMIEANRVALLQGAVHMINTPSASGAGQDIARCPTCLVALWSCYAAAGPAIRFIRVGTLDRPDELAPDIHIFTTTRLSWVIIPPAVPAMAEYYDRKKYWSAESLARYDALRPEIEEHARLRRERS